LVQILQIKLIRKLAIYLNTIENPADGNPWWQVDLKADYIITGVTILNRKDFGEINFHFK
jgi:hypothetical protein